MELSESHEVVVEFDGEWQAHVWPCVGREAFFNVDFCEITGLFSFNVAYSSGYYGDRYHIESWVKVECEKFYFNGQYCSDIRSLSVAMWAFEFELAANDPVMNDDVLECVGPLLGDVQIELFRSVG